MLAGCAGEPGAQDGTSPTAGPPSASAPSASAVQSPPNTQPTPGADQGDLVDADVVGQWGGMAEGSPVLWFVSSGQFTGNDGCNTLGGTWVASGSGIELKDLTMTLVACPGMDTWLSSAATVQVKGDTLRVSNANGKQIGTLPRVNVAD